ncbi:MAG: hypothetical protein CMD46_02750, partial [Gammaproteobacteria bacterium]|nr:hypothetical protein [Gammaproteobacteria bacterium]
DLHGERHHNVDDLIIDFVFQYQSKIPLIIICGNSQKMIKICETVLNKNSISFSMTRFGIIRIEKI